MVNHRTTPDDFRPTANWENLRLRADLLRRLRQFFDARGFLEVETPILSADTVVDRHLDPFCISPLPTTCGRVRRGAGGEGGTGSELGVRRSHSPSSLQSLSLSPASGHSSARMWLQTSPEFAMKRLLAAGAGPIYQVARVFRLDELGPLHNPEFTLVEWYQPGDGMDEGMQLTSDLCEAMLSSRHTPCAVGPTRHWRQLAVERQPTAEQTTAHGVCLLLPSASATAKRSSVTWASIRTRPTGRRWPRRPGRAASSRRPASRWTTATAGSIC